MYKYISVSLSVGLSQRDLGVNQVSDPSLGLCQHYSESEWQQGLRCHDRIFLLFDLCFLSQLGETCVHIERLEVLHLERQKVGYVLKQEGASDLLPPVLELVVLHWLAENPTTKPQNKLLF